MKLCVQCGNTYTLTDEEQAWYTAQFGEENHPKRCADCRKENKRESRRNRMQNLKDKNERLLERVRELEKLLGLKEKEEVSIVSG